jgi:hypothetical protein
MPWDKCKTARGLGPGSSLTITLSCIVCVLQRRRVRMIRMCWCGTAPRARSTSKVHPPLKTTRGGQGIAGMWPAAGATAHAPYHYRKHTHMQIQRRSPSSGGWVVPRWRGVRVCWPCSLAGTDKSLQSALKHDILPIYYHAPNSTLYICI